MGVWWRAGMFSVQTLSSTWIRAGEHKAAAQGILLGVGTLLSILFQDQ